MLSWFHPTKPMYISPIYIAVSSCIFVCNFSKLSHFEVNNYKIIPAIRAIFVISYFSVWVILGCTFLGDEYFLKNKNYRGIERNLCLELSFFFLFKGHCKENLNLWDSDRVLPFNKPWSPLSCTGSAERNNLGLIGSSEESCFIPPSSEVDPPWTFPIYLNPSEAISIRKQMTAKT